jgi:hypothetical protein
MKGAVIGALVLGATGLAFSVDHNTCNAPGSLAFCSRGEAVLGGAGAGALAGAFAGFNVKTDRFAPIDLNMLRPPPTAAARASRTPFSLGLTNLTLCF